MKYARTYIVGRVLFSFFFLLSSLYCLLGYIPFTYQQVIKGRLLPPLNTFAEWHSVLNVAELALAVLLLCFDRKKSTQLPRTARRMRLALLLLLFVETGFLCWRPVLANIDNGAASYVWSLLAFIPLLWLGILDWCELLSTVSWRAASQDEDRTHFRAACWTAAFVTILYGVIAYAPRGGINGLKATLLAGMFAFGVSALTHMLALILFFVALNLLMVIASWFGKPPRAQFIVSHLFGSALLWLVFRGIVFPGMAFQGWRADLYAIAFALTAAITSSGLCLRLYSRDGGELHSGFAFAFWLPPRALDRAHENGRWKTPAGMVLLAGSAAAIAIATARIDWNYLLQKLAAVLVWVEKIQR